MSTIRHHASDKRNIFHRRIIAMVSIDESKIELGEGLIDQLDTSKQAQSVFPSQDRPVIEIIVEEHFIVPF